MPMRPGLAGLRLDRLPWRPCALPAGALRIHGSGMRVSTSAWSSSWATSQVPSCVPCLHHGVSAVVPQQQQLSLGVHASMYRMHTNKAAVHPLAPWLAAIVHLHCRPNMQLVVAA